MRTGLALVVIVSVIATTAWMTEESRRNRLVWDHWDVVKPGILYRSGQLRPEQLEQAVKQYHLRTVISFQIPGDSVDSERDHCRRMGVEFLDLPMPGDGFGQEIQFREVLKACDDPERRPVLAHCARGTCRTGAAVAFYRFERDGWTIADVAAEMDRQTYRQGWLPGYVYAMVKDKPNAPLFDPPIIRDTKGPVRAPEPPPIEMTKPALKKSSAKAKAKEYYYFQVPKAAHSDWPPKDRTDDH